MATVLIIGASRGIGLETVKAALQAGHLVRALARSARRIAVDHLKLEKIAGDALDMAAVKGALTGVHAVIQSLGVSAGPEIIFEPTRLFSKATQVLVNAMEQAQVKRLICVTGFGAGDSRGHSGLVIVFTHVFEALHLFPWMHWGDEHSAGHYLTIGSAALGLTLFPLGYLLYSLTTAKKI